MNLSYMNPELWQNFACNATINSASGTMANVEFVMTQRGSSLTKNSNLAILTGSVATEWTDWLPKEQLYWDTKFRDTWETRFSKYEDADYWMPIPKPPTK